MILYNTAKPRVYVETTVVSYLAARPSQNVTLATRQQTTQQLWTEYADNFCHAAGFQPTTLCTPIELIEGIQMKDKIDPRMDPVLEECYRMKEEFAAKFNSMEELYNYLKAEQKKFKALGWKYLPPPQLRNEDNKEI